MCGIAGFFRPCGLAAADSERRLTASLSAMAHRGPDARGIKLFADKGVAFGHLRLSILDLDFRANQPMASPDKTVWIAYNGEIYNFKDIRAELETEGERFATTSDTEVLIRGYQRWGLEKILERSAGMFAFALYDSRRDRFYLVRDRAGKKPLYYCEQGGTLAFASEIKGLLPLLERKPGLSKDGLDAYLVLKFTPSPLTLLAGVSKVPPGHYMEFSRGASRTVEYWNPLKARRLAPQEALEAVEEKLLTAVRRRLVSDVPVCVFLSGGLDSGLIVSYGAEAGAGKTAAYTVGYEDMPEYNEFLPARVTAKRFGVDHREVVVSSQEVLSALQDDALVADDPIADWVWVPLHFLARRARADGFKVALLGEGSDELFFGYDVMLKGLNNIDRFESPLWRALAFFGYHLCSRIYAGLPQGHRRYDLWRRAAEGLPIYWGGSIGFPTTMRHMIAGCTLGARHDEPAGEFIARLYERFHETAPRADNAALVSWVEFYTKMGETLLQRVDRVTMRHSLEARAPFLDHDLVELAFSLPREARLPQGRLKGLLKDLARRRLPAEVVGTPKRGFSFPFGEWLRGPLRKPVTEALGQSALFADGWLNAKFCRGLMEDHMRGRDHAPRLWQLYSLARWYDGWAR